GCYVFDGIDDYINLSRVISSNNFTIEAWVNYKPMAFDGAAKTFFYQGTGSGDIGTIIGEYAGGACFYTASTGFCSGGTYWIKNTWIHVVGVSEGSGNNLTLYVNGTVVITGVGGGTPTNNPVSIGRWYDYTQTTLRYLNASVTDLRVYNFSMNASQVSANYIAGQARRNLLETVEAWTSKKGENWSACITPNDGLADGPTNCSIGLVVTNTRPSNVTLLLPTNGNYTITTRNVTFNWTAAIDLDNDNITYNLSIQCYSFSGGGCSPSDNKMITGIGTPYYTLEDDLRYLWDNNYYYNWTIIACDDSLCNASTLHFNFSVVSQVIIDLVNDTVNFSARLPGEYINTTNGSVGPLVIRNEGNVHLEVNISGERLFSSGSFPSSNYRYKARNMSTMKAFNSSSTFDWTNVPEVNQTPIKGFNYTSTNNDGIIDIEVTVPTDEPAGSKTSVLTFTGRYIG
ncbi:LamG domain-containing protein, partial [Candidatus Woesearchaeota archaeon]|nr:LamG domain-containing protein [Candidatus Woesearchaeota archaeon]